MLRIPVVAIYQTDMVAYVERYGIPGAAPLVASHVARLHRRATLTLAPSSASEQQLAALGVDRVRRWGRGVDATRFDSAAAQRGAAGASWLPTDASSSATSGGSRPRSRSRTCECWRGIPGIRLVIVGEGPSRAQLEKELPDAAFLGFLAGDALAEAMASLDVFVHPGESETFCQTMQEALASGVPVVATGRGGPLDLVRSSVDGWLYRPGDLADLRDRVADLAGDAGKRRAFGVSARESVRLRTWEALGHQLVGHYEDAISAAARSTMPSWRAARRVRPCRRSRYRCRRRSRGGRGTSPSATRSPRGCATARAMPDGDHRGWADRLAMLLAYARTGGERFRFANFAVRSRRVRHVIDEQIPRALALRPDLVSVLIGANDLVKWNADPARLAQTLGGGIRSLRGSGCDVLLVTPFLPRRRIARLLARRFAAFSAELRDLAADTGSMLLDLEAHPAIGDLELWAQDGVHLRTQGHRLLAYRAAEVLGVPDAESLGGLDAALHADDEESASQPRRSRLGADARSAVGAAPAGGSDGRRRPRRQARRLHRTAPEARRGEAFHVGLKGARPHQPLLRRNSRFCEAGPCDPCTTESPSRCASPSRLCAFFLSSASLNLRFMSSEAAPVGLSSVLMDPPYA